MANKGSAFWSDLSKKTGVWGGVGALVLALFEWGPEVIQGLTDHNKVMVGAAIIGAARAVLALIQGKVGDPDKASFSAAPADADKGD